jgi:hypothetical protein
MNTYIVVSDTNYGEVVHIINSATEGKARLLAMVDVRACVGCGAWMKIHKVVNLKSIVYVELGEINGRNTRL